MRCNPMIGSWEEVETNNRIAGKLAGGGRLGAALQEAWGQERREEEEEEAGGEEVGKGEQKCHTFTHKLEDEKVSHTHMSVLCLHP